MLNGKRNEEIFNGFIKNEWNDVFDKLNNILGKEGFELEAGETSPDGAIYLDYIGVLEDEVVEATVSIEYNGDYSEKSLYAYCSAYLDSLKHDDYEAHRKYQFNGNEDTNKIAKRIADTMLYCADTVVANIMEI